MKTFSDKCVDKLEVHILCSPTFFENLAVYEIMWKNIVERDRPQMTVWRMRIACWIRKATNTQGCVILIDFPQQKWLHEAPKYYVIGILPVLIIFRMYVTWPIDSPSRFDRLKGLGEECKL